MEPLSTAVVKAMGDGASELVKEQTKSFVAKVLDEPARALGGLFADRINSRRHRNLVSIVIKADQRLRDAGLSPTAVSLKIIHPLLENASLEEEPELQELWANLLANAAGSAPGCDVHPIFISTLRQLTSAEATFLNAFSDVRNQKLSTPNNVIRTGPLYGGFGEEQLLAICADAGLLRKPTLPTTEEERKWYQEQIEQNQALLRRILDVLKGHGIVEQSTNPLPLRLHDLESRAADKVWIETEDSYDLTQLGVDFLVACRVPSCSSGSNAPDRKHV